MIRHKIPRPRRLGARPAARAGRRLAGAERRRGLARRRHGGVAALVVNQDHAELAGIVLAKQRTDGLADAIGLVAGRDDRGDDRPRTVPGRIVVIALGAEPEQAPAGQEIEPDRDNQY